MADPVLRLPVALTMDVAFDLVCPWCWLGKHQLNTALAHRLLRQLDRPGAGASDPRVAVLMEAMFKAYFVEGKDIGQADVLWRLAVAAGASTGELQAWRAAGDAPLPPGPLAGGAVPCFQVDGRFLLEGAQSPQLLLRALRSALHAYTPEPSHA